MDQIIHHNGNGVSDQVRNNSKFIVFVVAFIIGFIILVILLPFMACCCCCPYCCPCGAWRKDDSTPFTDYDLKCPLGFLLIAFTLAIVCAIYGKSQLNQVWYKPTKQAKRSKKLHAH